MGWQQWMVLHALGSALAVPQQQLLLLLQLCRCLLTASRLAQQQPL
jgi:hypothetical protein